MNNIVLDLIFDNIYLMNLHALLSYKIDGIACYVY